jgi:hypothetical protein
MFDLIPYDIFIERIKSRKTTIYGSIRRRLMIFLRENDIKHINYKTINGHLSITVDMEFVDIDILKQIFRIIITFGRYPSYIISNNKSIIFTSIEDLCNFNKINIVFVADYTIKLNHINTLYSLTTKDDVDEFKIFSSDMNYIIRYAENILKEDESKEIFLVENDLTDLVVDIFNSEFGKDILKVYGNIPPNRKKILQQITKPIPIKNVISAPWF